MTIKECRVNLGWSLFKLAQEAGVTRQAAAGAESGHPVKAETVKAIAEALSRATGTTIKPFDLDGVNVL